MSRTSFALKTVFFRSLAAVAALVVFSAEAAAAPRQEYSDRDLQRIAATTVRILENNHFSGAKIDSAMSGKIFNRYFDLLDPSRMLFTAADVEKFAAFRESVGDRLRRGDCGFAFAVYDLYRKRYGEFRAFTREMLKKAFPPNRPNSPVRRTRRPCATSGASGSRTICCSTG